MVENGSQKTTFILGAGFSKNSGLPVQSEFAKLLFANDLTGDLDQTITKTLREFLNNVFRWNEGNDLPTFEDIFTCIDLSTGKNENLGIKYDPEALRSIQKMIIYRVFSILDRRFSFSEDINKLLRFFVKTNDGASNSSFIVLNWDIVLEKHLMQLGFPSINYCCHSYDWSNPVDVKQKGIPVCKMHGSSNWVYCKNCKTLFFDLYGKLSLRTKAGLEKSDFRRFDKTYTKKRFYNALELNAQDRECRICKNMPSTHIATFSYKKAFDTRLYSSIWDTAEKLLADSNHWVFIGYSLPEADYELKHLLKLAQLRHAHRKPLKEKKIDVVVMKDEKTKEKFNSFFGKNNVSFYNNGLSEYLQKACI